MLRRQRQNTGDDGLAVQSGRDTTICIGTSEARAYEIAQHVFDRELERYERTAYAIAAARVDQLRIELIERIKSIESERLSAFEDPDVQMLVLEAQKGYARSGFEHHKRVLVELIAARCGIDGGGLQAASIRGAVETVPRLTKPSIAAVTVVWLMSRVRALNVDSRSWLRTWADERLRPFVDDLPTGNHHYEYLEATGCATVTVLDSDLRQILRDRYPGLFQRGFDLPELDPVLSTLPNRAIPAFTDCLAGNGKSQLNALDGDAAESLLSRHDVDAETIEKYKQLLLDNRIDIDELERITRSAHPAWDTLFDRWSSTLIRRVRLNSVGHAIAHCYWTNVTGDEVDLSLWVPDE